MFVSEEALTAKSLALRRVLRWQRPPQWDRCEWFDELEAEANLAMLTALSSYESSRGVPLAAFVYERVFHALCSLYRREWQHALHVYSGNCLIEKGSSSQPCSVEAERLQEAIRSVPERECAVIYRTFFSGNTEREIAEELGVAAAVVHRLKKRALQLLREILCGGGRASKMPAKRIFYYGKKLNRLRNEGAVMRTLLSQVAGLLALANLALLPLLPRAIADYSGRGWDDSPTGSDLSAFLCSQSVVSPTGSRKAVFNKEDSAAPLTSSRMDCWECVKVGNSIPIEWCDSEDCDTAYWKKQRWKCRYNCGDGYIYAGCGPPAKVNCICLHGGAMPDCLGDGEKACGTSPCGT